MVDLLHNVVNEWLLNLHFESAAMLDKLEMVRIEPAKDHQHRESFNHDPKGALELKKIKLHTACSR